MRKTPRYVAASTVIVVTMLGSYIISVSAVNAEQRSSSFGSTVQIENVAKLDLANDLPLLKKGGLIRNKLRHIREKLDNSELLDVLSLTPSEFKQLRSEGKTLREIAALKSVDISKVSAVVEKQMVEKWERLLSNKIITEEKFDELVSEKDALVEKHLDSDGSRLAEKLKNTK